MVWKIIEPPSKTLRHYRGSPFGSPNNCCQGLHITWCKRLSSKPVGLLLHQERYLKLLKFLKSSIFILKSEV